MGYEKMIAKIESTSLGFESHGIFTAVLHVDYGSMSQGVGGFVMSNVNEPGKQCIATPMAADFVIRLLRACGVRKWEQLPGRTVYMLFAPEFRMNHMPDGIENLPTEPGERFLFKDWQDEVTAVVKKSKT